MRMQSMQRRLRRMFAFSLAISLLGALALPASAFDCTPIATLPNNGNQAIDYIGVNAVPGEMLCGFDYTGWDFHVYEFTIAGPTLQIFGLSTSDGNPFSGISPYAELLVLDQCDANACVFQWSSTMGATSQPVCLAAGTYTVVVASEEANGSNIYGVATASFDVCQPIANDVEDWGTLKLRF